MNWDPIWEDIFRTQSWGTYPGESLIRFIAANFYSAVDRSKIRILEVGCGPGGNIWYLAREGFSFAGIDGSETAIERSIRRLDKECPDWRARGDLRVGQIGNLPFSDAAFDAVLDVEASCCNSVEATKAIFSELNRVTKPGGKLYMQTFATGCWGDGSGEPVSHHAWRCAEGPLTGKGLARFTSLDEITNLVDGFVVRSIELLARSLNGRRHEIREWIVFAEKP